MKHKNGNSKMSQFMHNKQYNQHLERLKNMQCMIKMTKQHYKIKKSIFKQKQQRKQIHKNNIIMLNKIQQIVTNESNLLNRQNYNKIKKKKNNNDFQIISENKKITKRILRTQSSFSLRKKLTTIVKPIIRVNSSMSHYRGANRIKTQNQNWQQQENSEEICQKKNTFVIKAMRKQDRPIIFIGHQNYID